MRQTGILRGISGLKKKKFEFILLGMKHDRVL